MGSIATINGALAQTVGAPPRQPDRVEQRSLQTPTGVVVRGSMAVGAAQSWATPALVFPAVTIGRPPSYEPKPQNPPIRRTASTSIILTAVKTSTQSARVSVRRLQQSGAVEADLPPQTLAPFAIATFESTKTARGAMQCNGVASALINRSSPAGFMYGAKPRTPAPRQRSTRRLNCMSLSVEAAIQSI